MGNPEREVYMQDVPYKPEKGKTALVVVDVQNVVLAPGSWLEQNQYPRPERMVPVTNKLISFFREKKMPIIWVITHLTPQTCHAFSMYFSIFGPPTYYLSVGSEEAKIWKEFSPQPEDVTVIKHHMSAFFETDLDTKLRSMGIEYPCVAGINTDQCVEGTVRNACERLYKSITVRDATSTAAGKEAYEMAFNRLRIFTRVMTSDELITELS
jgi:ureidoacrylate peracid hydrolase